MCLLHQLVLATLWDHNALAIVQLLVHIVEDVSNSEFVIAVHLAWFFSSGSTPFCRQVKSGLNSRSRCCNSLNSSWSALWIPVVASTETASTSPWLGSGDLNKASALRLHRPGLYLIPDHILPQLHSIMPVCHQSDSPVVQHRAGHDQCILCIGGPASMP